MHSSKRRESFGRADSPLSRTLGIGLTLLLFTGLYPPTQGVAEEIIHLVPEREPHEAGGSGADQDAMVSIPPAAHRSLSPTVRLGGSRAIETRFNGSEPTAGALRDGRAQPLSLASADFDEDGVPDLVCGFATAGGGVVTLHRGNVDALYPNSPQAQERRRNKTAVVSPFWPDAAAIDLPQAPDYLAAGDFDADGHQDIVSARSGGRSIDWMQGDGAGGFREPIEIAIEGSLTALAAGDVNRRDGLADIMVGMAGPDGPELLVFEDPRGALRGEPERLPLPGRPTALAIGEFDRDYPIDIAVAAGRHVVVVRGRDRRISLGQHGLAEVPAAELIQAALPFTIDAMEAGDFGSDRRPHLALTSEQGDLHLLPIETFLEAAAGEVHLSDRLGADRAVKTGIDAAALLVAAKVSNLPGRDLIVIERSGGAPPEVPAQDRNTSSPWRMDDRWAASSGGRSAMVEPGPEEDLPPIAILPMRLGPSALTDLVILSEGESSPKVIQPDFLILTVSNTNDSGPASLRQAILDANATPGVDLIAFNIPGVGVQTIRPLTPLPQVSEAVVIDGTSQPGFAGTPLIELSGELISSPAGPGLWITGGGSTIRGLTINRFTMGDHGGIHLTTNGANVVEGNFLGTDATGTMALGSQSGVRVQSSNNIIGGTTAAARNLVSGHEFDGVLIKPVGGSGIDVTFNQVLGNYIGTDVTGTLAVNGGIGGTYGVGSYLLVMDEMAANNTIGGTVAGSRNVIAGELVNVRLRYLNGGGNLVQGNLIGTNATGSAAISSDQLAGVIARGPGITIGGTSPTARNIISGQTYIAPGGLGSDGGGIQLRADDTLVQGNFIGTDINGVTAIPNTVGGIHINSSWNTIGGALSGALNVISGNLDDGIIVRTRFGDTAPTGNMILGNFIGTDVSGSFDLGNALHGVRILDDTASTTIGGPAAGEGNVISGNASMGIYTQIDSTGNLILGNLIGTQADGVSPLGNGSHGVFLKGGPDAGNRVGGTEPGEGNVIAYNQIGGIAVLLGTGNTLLSNEIHSHGSLGIDLDSNGVTPNDPGDIDSGANNLQNFPIITSVSSSPGSGTTVQGTIDSVPGEVYLISVFASNSCDPSGYGEGETFLGTAWVLGNDGSESFIGYFQAPIAAGQVITATATRYINGDTSEFSACFTGFIGRPGGGMGAVSDLQWGASDGTALDWSAAPGASTYALFRGAEADIGFLRNTGVDSCLRAEVTDTTTGPLLTEEPALGTFDWYLVRPSNGAGDAPPGEASPETRFHDAATACISTCAHDTCTIGTPLALDCEPCVEQICLFDPYCCNNAWDAKCVAEVRVVCKSLKCSEASGSCAHNLCVQGSALATGCDNAIPSQSCVEQICAVDPFCCNQFGGGLWDSACVHQVDTICGKRCY